MPQPETALEIVVRLYEPADWAPLWQVHLTQLVEEGVDLDIDDVPSRISEEDARTALHYGEEDLFYIDETYLCGGGGFWQAWIGEKPVGSVGAQDLGGAAELRRMFVRADYRRLDVGTRLVDRLIEHCTVSGIRAVELWTAPDGLGKFLYKKMGFRMVDGKGLGFESARDRPNEIRMHLDLPGREVSR